MPASYDGHRHYWSVEKNLHPPPRVIVTCIFFSQDTVLTDKGLFSTFHVHFRAIERDLAKQSPAKTGER